MMEELPKGWATATVDELAFQLQYGTSAKTSPNPEGIPVLRMGNIQEGKILFDSVKTLPVDHPGIQDLLLFKGDVLFNRTNSPELVGKTAVFHGGDPTSFASYLIRIRFKDSCLPDWFCRYINSKPGRSWIASVANQQVGQANVSGGKLREFVIPIPPIKEQRRIVAKLEALLAKVDTSRKRLERIPTILKRFRQAILASACEGRLTEDWRGINQINLEDWKNDSLGEVADLRLGKMLDHSKNIGDPTPYLRNINVRWFRFELDDLSLMRATESDRDEFSICSGDLLVCEGGEPGRCAVWEGGGRNLIFQKALHRVRLPENISPHWVAMNLWHDASSGRLGDLFTGSTIKHLTGRSLSAYPISIPLLSEQNEIKRRVDQLFTLADQIESRYLKAKAQVDRITQSILAKAFRGELVPQDPREEPAAALLTRIRTHAPTLPPARRRGRPKRED